MLTNESGDVGGRSRSLRLSFVLSELRLSGGVRVVLEYAERLAARGHQVTLISSIDPDDPATLTPPRNVEFVALRQRLERQKVLANLSLAVALALKTPHSDFIIATHTPTVPSVLLACQLLRRGRAAWLYQDYPEMFAERPLERAILTVSPRLIAHVFCVSTSGAVEVWRYGQRRPVIVGEGLSNSDGLSPRPESCRDATEVAYIGDTRPRKGLADLVAAMQIVHRVVPTARLTVISRDRVVLPRTVPHQIVRLPSDKEIADLLARCGVFVSSSWFEGFGLPALEAMACGAPVVIADSRGVREYAEHEGNCLLVPPRDPPRLAEAIIRLLRDRELASRLATAGIATAARFSWAAAVDRFEWALMEIHRLRDDP